MAKLVLLNGPPGIGKSTLARRFVRDRLFAFCLDVDDFRRLIGNWYEHEHTSGVLARRMAVAMARVHLSGGNDVVVPQYLAKVDFIAELETLASETESTFHEIVLMDDRTNALARFAERARDASLAEHHRDTERMAGGAVGVGRMYEQLQLVLESRPNATVVRTRAGELEQAYQDLLDAVGDHA